MLIWHLMRFLAKFQILHSKISHETNKQIHTEQVLLHCPLVLSVLAVGVWSATSAASASLRAASALAFVAPATSFPREMRGLQVRVLGATFSFHMPFLAAVGAGGSGLFAASPLHPTPLLGVRQSFGCRQLLDEHRHLREVFATRAQLVVQRELGFLGNVVTAYFQALGSTSPFQASSVYVRFEFIFVLQGHVRT